MTHFRQAHQELRVTDAIIDQLGFQSSNVTIEQIVELLRADDEAIPPLPPPAPAQVLPVYDPPPQVPQANAVTPVDQNAALMKQMMQNMQMIHENMPQMAFHGHGRGRGHRRG